MQLNKKVTVLMLVALCSLAVGAEDPQTVEVTDDDVDRNTINSQQSSRLNVGDLTIPNSLVAMVANGGAVAAGILVVAALAMLLMPALGLRMCNVFGNCDNAIYQAYSATPNSVYGDYQQQAYGQGGTYNNPTYQKRSIEYIAPVLKALGTAYEKYNRQGAAATMKKTA